MSLLDLEPTDVEGVVLRYCIIEHENLLRISMPYTRKFQNGLAVR